MIVVQFDAPAATADVGTGFFLELQKWTYGATAAADSAVLGAAQGGSTTIRVQRSDVTAVPGSNPAKWQVSLDRTADLFCGLGACGNGKYALAAFGAISRFSTSGQLAASLADGAQVASSDLPATPAFAYYGEACASRQQAPHAGWCCTG